MTRLRHDRWDHPFPRTGRSLQLREGILAHAAVVNPAAGNRHGGVGVAQPRVVTLMRRHRDDPAGCLERHHGRVDLIEVAPEFLPHATTRHFGTRAGHQPRRESCLVDYVTGRRIASVIVPPES